MTESRTQSQAERTNHVIGSNESAASDEAHCNNSKPEEKLNNDKQTEVQSPEDADSSTYTDRENVADDSTSPSNQNQGTQILKRCPVELSEASNSEKSTNAQSMSTNGNISEFTQTGVEDTHEESTNAVSMSTNESTSESSQTGVEDEFSNVKHDASNQNEPAHSLERESALASIDTSNSDESTNGQSMSINENTSKLSPTGTEHTNRKNTDPATSKLNEFSIVEPRLKLKHEDGSLLSRCTDMKKETLATRIPLEILLLGDSGVGKTSLFKLMKLYADMNGLFSEETFKKRIQNISFIPLSTATTITYDAIYIENLAITVIDTPGFDEATSKDGKSWAENISHEVQRLKNLNCICLVINGTESRLTWHTSDVIKRLSSFLPKDLFQNVVVFFTHTSDDFSLTFADETLTTELGFPLKHTHVIDNPYARYCKANRRRRKIKSSLINDEFPEAFETLSQVLRTIKNFTKADDSHTDIFGNFSVLKDRIETCVDNLSKFNNEMKAQKVVLKEKEELEENKKTLKKTLVTERVSYTEIQSMSLDVPRDTEMQNMSLDVPKSKAEFLLECMIELQTIGTHNPSQLNFVVDVKKKLDEMSELRNMGRLDDIWKKIDEKVTCIISKT